MTDFNEQYTYIQSDLEDEELRGPLRGATDIAIRLIARKDIQRRIERLIKEVRLLQQRYKRLPLLPERKGITWAQNILAFPNSVLLVVDAESQAHDASIVRILILDISGSLIFDRLIASGYVLTKQTREALGVTSSDFQQAVSLPQMWTAFLTALAGSYIITYDLPRTQRLLEAHAHQYDLEVPVIIGDCLLQQWLHYCPSAGLVGLHSLCEALGQPLPKPPDQTALDRALGQLHVLQAMAQGRTIAGYETLAYTSVCSDEDFYGDISYE